MDHHPIFLSIITDLIDQCLIPTFFKSQQFISWKHCLMPERFEEETGKLKYSIMFPENTVNRTNEEMKL
jgi:hypothetical protein